MKHEYSKTSDTHELPLNLSEELNLERSDKYIALTNLSTFIQRKI